MSHRKSLPEPIARLEAHLREQRYSAEACKRSLCNCQGNMINHGGPRCVSFGAVRVDHQISEEVLRQL
jgi:hypothetical protein